MKKIIFLCMVFIMLLSVGCSKNDKDTSEESKETSKNNEQKMEAGGDTIEQLESDISNGTAYIYNYPNTLDISNFEGKSFSDGVAWVKFVIYDEEEEDATLNYYCIDKKGKILFEINSAEPTSDFLNGKATLNNNTVIDKKGKVISSADDGLYDEIISNTIGDGVFVKQDIDEFDEKATKIGLLNVKNNEWIIEPTEEITGVDDIDLDNVNFKYKEDYEKQGDNLHLLEGVNVENRWYNCETNTIISRSEYDDIIDKQNGKDINTNDLEGAENYSEVQLSNFDNGYCFVLFKGFDDDSDWYTVMNSEGEYMFEPRKAEHGLSMPTISCGVFLIDLYGQETLQCMDINGNILVDNVPANISESKFKDDVLYIAPYSVRENGTTKSYAGCYIDKHGKQLWNWKTAED